MKKKSRNWDVDLGFGINAYVTLGMAGFFGLLPLTAGLASIAGFFGAFASDGGSISQVGSVIVGVLTVFSIAIGPWLVPALVLRARQPKGAGIAWTTDEIVEWNGPWRRTVIRWENAEGAQLAWQAEGHYRRTRLAIQVLDKTNPQSVITAWEEEPDEVPILRRRFETSRREIGLLDAAVKAHCGYSRSFEMERLADRDRPVQSKLVRNVTRLGYVAAFFGPLLAMPNPIVGVAISAVAFPLLAWRASPVFCEIFYVRAHFRDARENDPNELQAWRYRLRSVLAEAFVRGAVAILPICGTAAALLTSPK